MEYMQDGLAKEIELTKELNEQLTNEIRKLIMDLEKKEEAVGLSEKDIELIDTISYKLNIASNQLSEIKHIVIGDYDENKSRT